MLTLPQNKARLSLSARLSAIAESLPQGGTVCDVGSDHGALPIYLLESGRARHVIATDIHEKPLVRAKEALSACGLLHQATLLLTDGLPGVFSFSVDAVVIAGMGGETIAGILSRSKSEIPVGTFFALQPMTKVPQLRAYLFENGFSVERERVVRENGKFFLILFACFDGVKREADEKILQLGALFSSARTEDALAYAAHLCQNLERKIQGKKRAKLPCREEEDLICALKEWMDMKDENL